MWRKDKPTEHESIFAKFKGTNKWMKSMFEMCSDEVLATIEFRDGSRKVIPAHTTDGVWRTGYDESIVHFRVVSWKPFPEPDKEN